MDYFKKRTNILRIVGFLILAYGVYGFVGLQSMSSRHSFLLFCTVVAKIIIPILLGLMCLWFPKRLMSGIINKPISELSHKDKRWNNYYFIILLLAIAAIIFGGAGIVDVEHIKLIENGEDGVTVINRTTNYDFHIFYLIQIFIGGYVLFRTTKVCRLISQNPYSDTDHSSVSV